MLRAIHYVIVKRFKKCTEIINCKEEIKKYDDLITFLFTRFELTYSYLIC